MSNNSTIQLKEEINTLQNKFDKAELHADTAALQELLADDFFSIGPKGFVLDKQQWIDRHTQFKYQKLETSDMNIHLYHNTAIVTNIQANEAKYKDEPVKLKVRVCQVWIKQENKWKLVSIQFSPLAEMKS